MVWFGWLLGKGVNTERGRVQVKPYREKSSGLNRGVTRGVEKTFRNYWTRIGRHCWAMA